ncbi:TPA: hypothetical protein RVG59_003154 [Escherichia coli]|nr:hypothetical protein [Escherichia coli]EKX2430887.1 hypothetical protein [Escherichia coli]ELV3604656.1 hypothetical protein [Escherichia coli]HAO1247183.1 hypothetical protein [Escherichia coli]HCI9375009.1 hypothetical protein [Escherichia coli]
MLPSETMIWQPEFTDKTLSRKPGAVQPAERHQGNDMKILAARKAVYQLAREQHPERWGKHLRNWDYISEVYLNPEKEAA